jgi:O-antigen/teichoic acid export membrane protein
MGIIDHRPTSASTGRDEPHSESSPRDPADTTREARADERRAPGRPRVLGRILSDGSLTKKASLNAAASTSEQIARTLVGLLVTPFLLSRLGAAMYGVWQVLLRLIGHASPASGRPGEALKWTVAHDQASTDHERKRRAVGNALAVWGLFLPLLLGIGGVVAWFAPGWLDAQAASDTTVRVAAMILVIDAALFSLFYLPQSILQGENLGYKRLGVSILLVLVSKAALLLVAYLEFGIVGMAVATVAGTVLWGVAYVFIARSQVPWFGIARPSRSEVRGFVGLSWWFLLWNLVMQMMQAADVVVLGIVVSPVLVTTYTLARYLPQAITIAVATLIFSIMPGLGRLVGAGDLDRAARIRTETISLVWLMTAVAGTTVLLWEETFLRVWVGARYYPGSVATLMIIVMVMQFALIRTDANIIDLTLNLRRKVMLGLASAVVCVALGWLLLEIGMGLVGLVLGFIVGRLILSFAYPLMIGRLLGVAAHTQIRGAVRPAVVTVLLFVGAAIASRVIDAASWPALLVGGAVSAAIVAPVAFYGGLPPRMRVVVWRRLRRVARLT